MDSAPAGGVSESMLAAVVRGASDAMGIIDDTGLILYVNDFAARQFGHLAEEFVGRNLFEFTHPDDHERGIEMVAASIDGGDGPDQFSPPVLARALHRDGAYRYVAVTGGVVARTEERTYLSVLLRPADEFVAMHASLRSMVSTTDIDEVLTNVLQIVRWQLDRPLVALVRQVDGGLGALGDALPPELCGRRPSTGSPWEHAWTGTVSRGTTSDLEPELRAVAEREGFGEFWVRPVQRPDGSVVAVVTLWFPTGRSLLAWDLNVDFMIDAASLALAYHDQRSQLEHAAGHDALTGLPNRRAFHDALTALSAEGRPTPCAVLYIDLDGFKPVNDSFGHAAGDSILAEVGNRLRALAAPDDLLSRLGGDEFCVLRPATSRDDAMALADRIVEEMARPFAFASDADASADGLSASIGASVGVAIGTADAARLLVTRADDSLYHAKSLGGRRAHLAG